MCFFCVLQCSNKIRSCFVSLQPFGSLSGTLQYQARYSFQDLNNFLPKGGRGGGGTWIPHPLDLDLDLGFQFPHSIV